MKKHALSYLLICLIGLSSAYAQEPNQPSVRTDHPDSYTVVRGDTLWAISGRFLEDPWRWKEIWQGNTQITNPDLIYPGDVIRLIFVDGKPQLVVNSPAPVKTEIIVPPTPTRTSNHALKTVKLSPKIHSTPIKTAIPAIPLEKINKFLLDNRVVNVGALDAAPHVIAGQEGRVILSAGDNIYARGTFDTNTSSYGLYTKGQNYIDPDTEEVLGVQAIDLGAVNLQRLEGDIGTFTITRSTSEVRVGTRLMPNLERQITSNFLPTPPKNNVEGLIMTVEKGVSQAGRLDIIAINLGERENIQQGHVLAIYKRGKKIKDRFAQEDTSRSVVLPDERAGLVMVFQVFEKMSLAIVLEAEKGVVIRDLVRTP